MNPMETRNAMTTTIHPIRWTLLGLLVAALTASLLGPAASDALAQPLPYPSVPEDKILYEVYPLYATEDLRQSLIDAGATEQMGWWRLYNNPQLFVLRVQLTNLGVRTLPIQRPSDGDVPSTPFDQALQVQVSRDGVPLVEGVDFEVEIVDKAHVQTVYYTAGSATTDPGGGGGDDGRIDSDSGGSRWGGGDGGDDGDGGDGGTTEPTMTPIPQPTFQLTEGGYYEPAESYDDVAETTTSVATLPAGLETYEGARVDLRIRGAGVSWLGTGVYTVTVAFDATSLDYNLPPYAPRVLPHAPLTIVIEQAKGEYATARSYRVRANRALEQGDLAEAGAQLEAAVREAPLSIHAWRDLTLFYRNEVDDPAAALEAARRWRVLIESEAHLSEQREVGHPATVDDLDRIIRQLRQRLGDDVRREEGPEGASADG